MCFYWIHLNLWTSRELITDILTFLECLPIPMGKLSLFSVEGSLVRGLVLAFHVIFAEIYVHLLDIEVSCSSPPGLQHSST